MEAGKQVKEYGRPNDLVQRIANDPSFELTEEEILKILRPENLCGRAKNQVIDFLQNDVKPVIEKYSNLIKDVDTKLEV